MDALIILVSSFLSAICFQTVNAGETCNFVDGDATVAVFCDDGCCESQCCGNSNVDETAIAIALACVIGFLLLIVFIILLIYCYHRSRKGKPVDEMKGRRKPSSATSRNEIHPARPYFRNNATQTGDLTRDTSKDRIVFGSMYRWNNYNPYPRPRLNSGVTEYKQTQTVETGASVFASQRAMRTNLAEPKVSVPAPYWRYHKKATEQSKDIYSLMERKARTSRVSRMEVGNETPKTLIIDEQQKPLRNTSGEERPEELATESWKEKEMRRAQEERLSGIEDITLENEVISSSRRSVNTSTMSN